MLPALREELSLYPGPKAANGAPTWSLLDPVRNLFFRIDWLTFEILSRWNLNDPEKIVQAITEETTIEAEPEDVEGVVRFLGEHELITRHTSLDGEWLAQQARKRTPSRWQWLLHHYLFFRVPLWRPDAWLNRNLRWTTPLYSRGFLLLTLAVLLIGLLQVSQQWQTFISTLLDTFSWQGLLGYLVTLVAVKFLHELGHAFTAKRYGCRVPTMGVAFLVMFPMAYTDVNETWKLPDRRQRLAVGAAGILTELTLAAWATFAWAMLPDGFLRSAAFLLATTTWISTLLINASPFLRFDGYFLLMDWLDQPNLHQRSFDFAKWRLREFLFRLREPLPEHLSPQLQSGFTLFGYLVWIYRFVVFGGIALLLFHAVPKPLGQLLAAIEITYFIALPIWHELRSWGPRMPRIMRSPRSLLSLSLLALVILLLFFPWDQRVKSQGLLRPAKHLSIVAPGPAVVESIAVQNGMTVSKGTPLIMLNSPDLAFLHKAASAKATNLRWQATAAGVDEKIRQRQQVIEASRGKVQSEIRGIAKEQARYHIEAPFSGRFYLMQPDLHSDTWVAKNERLAILADTSQWLVETYLPESQLNRVKVGDYARFMSETPDLTHVALRVVHIDRDASHVLTDGILSSTRGGALLSREQNKRIVPEHALYRIALTVTGAYTPARPQVLRGQVIITGKAEAWADEFIRTAAGFFVRESAF